MIYTNLNHYSIYSFALKLFLLSNLCILTLNCVTQREEFNTAAKNQIISPEKAVNINIATVEELKSLPNIGDKTAQEIIAYREKFGRFRKPEHLLLVKGISDARFRKIRNFIKTE